MSNGRSGDDRIHQPWMSASPSRVGDDLGKATGDRLIDREGVERSFDADQGS